MKHQKHFRTTLNITVMVVLVMAASVLVSPQGPEATKPPAAIGGCSDLTGTWTAGPKMVIGSRRKPLTDEVLTWELTKYVKKGTESAKSREEHRLERYENPYRVRESPRDAAFNRRDAELLSGNVLRLTFTVRMDDELYQGRYECKLDANCQSSVSPCQLEVEIIGRGWVGTGLDMVLKRKQPESTP